MEKKTLDMYYTTIQKLQEDELISRFLSSLEGKFTQEAGTSHIIKCSINIAEKQISALFDSDIKIIARITSQNVRSESLTELPELMKIFESTKKELEEEYDANPEVLSALEPIMHIHSCTVEISSYSGSDRKCDYTAKKLIDRIALNKKIIILR